VPAGDEEVWAKTRDGITSLSNHPRLPEGVKEDGMRLRSVRYANAQHLTALDPARVVIRQCATVLVPIVGRGVFGGALSVWR
jgi:hypothetical protein